MSEPPFVNRNDARFVAWHKSSASGGNESCLYISTATDGSGDVAIADSKAGPDGPVQVYTRTGWNAFLSGVKGGVLGSL